MGSMRSRWPIGSAPANPEPGQRFADQRDPRSPCPIGLCDQAAVLGLPPPTFLGYPDAGLAAP
jgi:hypothetical protein